MRDRFGQGGGNGGGLGGGLGGVVAGAGVGAAGGLLDAVPGGGVVSRVFGRGGRATEGTQIMNNIELAFLSVQAVRQLEAQLRHLMANPLDSAADVLGALAQLRAVLGATDATVYDLNRAAGVYRGEYPEDLGGMSTREVIDRTERWRGSAHRAIEESWRLQSGVVQGQEAARARVGQQLGAVQAAPGMLAAQQGTAQLIASMFGEVQSLQSVTVSHYRAVEHSLAQQQAREARAEELHRRAMRGFGQSDTVNVRSPF